MIKNLRERVPFYYTTKEALYDLLRNLRCFRKRFLYRNELYNYGKQSVEKVLDIKYLIKQMRDTKLLKKMLL